MLRRFFHTLWLLFALLLLLVAVLLTSARVWVPSLSEYRLEIEQAAGQLLQKQVTIGRLEATWRGLNPVLKLKNVVLADPAGEQASLAIREIWITVDAGEYLAEQAIKLAGIDVIGADLVVIRDASGQVYLDGFRGDGSDNSALQELGNMARLSVHDVSLTFIDERYDEPPQRVSAIALSLDNDGYAHTLTGHALLPATAGYRVDVEAELHGRVDQPSTWQGQLYAKVQLLALSAVPARYLPEGMGLDGVADVRLWADIADLAVVAVSGELDTRDLQISHVRDDKDYRFKADDLKGQFGWRQAGDGWQFALQRLVVTQDGHTWQTANLSLASDADVRHGYIKGVSERIVLDGFGALLPVIPGLAPEDRQLLAGLQPRGLVKELVFNLSTGDAATQLDHFTARFSGISTGEAGAFPMVSGLDGSVVGNLQAGTLTLDSRNVSIRAAGLFREGLSLDSLQGDIHWQGQDARFEVGTAALTLANRDLSLAAAFAVDIPADGAASINLQLDVKTADIGRVHAYLPAGKMSPKAVEWLDRSLKRGTVTDGRVSINGRFDQIPFDNGEGVLEVRLPVTAAELDFHPGWSPLTAIDAQVNFTGRSMDILGHSARIRTAALENIRVQIADLARALLTIKGDVQGELPVMLAELGSSTLGGTYGGFVDSVTTTGEASLALTIELPLTKTIPGELKVAGTILLADNTLQVNSTEYLLKQIGGRLDFDSKGIKGEHLHASLFGKPANVWVWTDAGVTNIRLVGPFDVLQRYVGRDNALGAAISGSSDWQVLVAVRGMPGRNRRADVGVTLTSTLVGTGVDLPAPFGKDSDSTRELLIELGDAVKPVKTLRIVYGRVLRGVLNVAPGEQGYRLQKVALAVGGGTPVLPAEEIMQVNGELGRLYVSEWKKHLGNGANDGSTAASLPVKLDLQLDELEVQGFFLNDVSVVMASAGNNWRIRAEGAGVSGDVNLITGGAGLDKVTMNLEKLVLRSGEQAASDTPGTASPADFPDLEIAVKQLKYNEANLGRLELRALKLPGKQYTIESLKLKSELLDLKLTGNWRINGDQQLSSVDLKVHKGKMDRLMKVFGYLQSIEDGEVSGGMRVSWPGALWEFSPAIAEGKLRIKIEHGQLLDVEPGAAGRILGLTSLHKLPQRLLLDFDDLYKEGFTFDWIKGSFTLEDGNAYTNDLAVRGPSARIEISGRVGLAAQDYDELVTVTPYMKTGLSLAGALAAGPAVGAALIVAKTLLDDKLGPLGRIGQTQYSVTGPWEDPVIEKLGSKAGQTDAVEEEDIE